MLFVIEYFRPGGTISHLKKYPDAQRADALSEYFRLERKHREEPDMEVVLLESTSEEELQQTHRRYFRTFSELTQGPNPPPKK